MVHGSRWDNKMFEISNPKDPERSSRLVQICDTNRTRFKRVKQDATSNDHESMQMNSGADLIALKMSKRN